MHGGGMGISQVWTPYLPYISYVAMGDHPISGSHSQLLCKAGPIVPHQPVDPSWEEWLTVPFRFTSIKANYSIAGLFVSCTNLTKPKRNHFNPFRNSEMTPLFHFACVFFHFFQRRITTVLCITPRSKPARFFTVFCTAVGSNCLKESSQPSLPRITGVSIL